MPLILQLIIVLILNYILQGLEGGLFIIFSSLQPLKPFNCSSETFFQHLKTLSPQEKKHNSGDSILSQFCQFRHDFREIAKPLCALLPAVGRWKE